MAADPFIANAKINELVCYSGIEPELFELYEIRTRLSSVVHNSETSRNVEKSGLLLEKPWLLRIVKEEGGLIGPGPWQ